MSDEKKYQNWPDLVLYTKEIKEWIWKLFRKVHARIGHVEEELAKVKEHSTVDYQLKQYEEDNTYIYKLIETVTQTEHGTIVFDASSGIAPIIWEDVYENDI